MISTSCRCFDMYSMSVAVRFNTLGRLDGGGDVLAVVPLSFVGVLEEPSDSVPSPWNGCDRGSGPDSEPSYWGARVPNRPGFLVGALLLGDGRGDLSIGSGLEVLGINCLSNTFASEGIAGPVSGPVRILGSALGRLAAPTTWAFANRSSIFCISTSPVTRACALAIAAFGETVHPIRSFINSIERFKTVCRLCMRSSDWWAKEKEWSDSTGKRERSSVKVGEPGHEASGIA